MECELVTRLTNTLDQVSGHAAERMQERLHMEDVIELTPFVVDSGR